MKMRNILGLLAATALFTACVEGNDWDTDNAYNRLFQVNPDKISVNASEVNLTTVTWQWSGISDAAAPYFIIEASTDTLYDEVAMGGENAIVFGEDQSIKGLSAALRGLYPDEKYYLRIKAVDSNHTAGDSHWSYATPFTTAAEQLFGFILNSHCTEDAISLNWEAGAEVTTLQVWQGEELVRTIDLTGETEAKAAGRYTVTGLQGATTYTFRLLNGRARRGAVSATTKEPLPTTAYSYYLQDDELTQAILDLIATNAKAAAGSDTDYSATITIPEGQTVDIKSDLTLPDGMGIIFEGEDETAGLNITKTVNLNGSHHMLIFHRLTIDGQDVKTMFGNSDATTIAQFTFTDCRIRNIQNNLLSLNKNCEDQIGAFKIENCVVDNCGNSGYMIAGNNAANTIGSISIINSTITNMAYGMIDVGGCKGLSGVEVTSCTFYNTQGDGRYLINLNGSDCNLAFTKCLFALTYSPSCRGVRVSSGYTTSISNVYLTSDYVMGSYGFKTDLDYEPVASDKLFRAPLDGDFHVLISDLLELGDPRWLE